jgi:hypothetical protein
MSTFKDLTGKKFGRLVVTGQAPSRGKGTRWECVCDCGGNTIVFVSNLTRGHTTSCGCWARESTKRRMTTHGRTRTAEHDAWMEIKKRCTDENYKQRDDYGGRGISICEEWTNNFSAFLSHIGLRPSPEHSVDRIDNDGNYEPGNVRWATRTTQNNNSRRNHKVTLNGESVTLATASRLSGIKSHTILSRLRRGWDEHSAIFSPLVPPEYGLSLGRNRS